MIKEGKNQYRNAKTKQVKGQITVLAGLSFGIIMTLLVVLIESAICMGARTKMNMAVNLSVQSLFSQYSRPVLERYEIFGGVFEEPDVSKGLLYQYLKKNIDTDDSILSGRNTFSPYDIQLSDLVIEEQKMLTDDDGQYFYGEITEYMKYGQFQSDILDLLPEITKSQNVDDLKELNQDLEKRQKEAGKIDAKILKLLMCVEGIKTTSSGLKQSFGHLSGVGHFVKKICVNGTGFGQTGVSHSAIYQAVSGHYYDLPGKLNDLKGDLDFIKYIYFYPATKGMFLDVGYRTNAYNISSELQETMNCIQEAMGLISEIEQEQAALREKMKQTRAILDTKRGKLDAGVVNAYEQEIGLLENYANGSQNKLCNLSEVQQGLCACMEALGTIKAAVDAVALVPMDIDTIDSVYGMIDECIATCRIYPGAQIVFNYDGLSLGKGEHISFLENIKNYFSQNMYRLVIEDFSKVSDKKLVYQDLSSKKCKFSKSSNSLLAGPADLYKDFLFNRYVSQYFSNYLEPNENGLLSYEMEYILGKEDSDSKNLNEVITQLVNLRFAMNLSYILCDMAKKMECEAKATAILGFTGVYAVIKMGQFLLLTAWAYAEAIYDVKILVQGGKVPFIKTMESWKTSLEDVIAMQTKNASVSGTTGLNYSQYLQILMLLQDKNRKTFRTMDMVETNMICAGYGHIRMYHYVYSMKGKVCFFYRRGKHDYEQEFSFSY